MTTLALSTHEDVDTRHDGRRLLVDTYELHADHVDQIRVSLANNVRRILPWLEGDSDNYWATELWQIHRTMLALGIDSD